jgi:hypothetical protein
MSRGDDVTNDSDPTAQGLWLAARALGDEPCLEWAFFLHAVRSLALQTESGPDKPLGMDLYFEHLSTWEDVLGVFAINRVLTDGGVPRPWYTE